MIFIDNDNTLGSKSFTNQLAQAIRPMLEQRLTADALDDFDLNLLQNMVSLDDLAVDDFNFVFDEISVTQDIDEEWQAILIKTMQADSRFKATAAT